MTTESFAVQRKFSTYIEQLQKIVPQKCAKCRTEFCFACGDKITQEASDPLWHCANLQGAILGVGLFMIERLFERQKEDLQSKDVTEREAKRRKTRDSDDIDSSGGSKKSKGGVGYAGDQKEDVSVVLSFLSCV